ncbi:MAG: exosome complex RNA-binding protein Csl4 [Candidatus Bathyarchaeia archaeon]
MNPLEDVIASNCEENMGRFIVQEERKMPRRSDERSGQFVVPGDRLGVIEEFLPGEGTYVDDGTVYSFRSGHAEIDLKNKTVSIRARTRIPPVPKRGDIVLARVMGIQEKSLSMRIFKVGKTSISTPFSGLMHVSDVMEGFVRTMSDSFRVGDIIRARVISTANRRFHLSTEGERLGVVYSYCSHCGQLLVRRGNSLYCPVCRRFRHRKAASDYGKANV